MLSKVWHEIAYLFPRFNGCTVEVCEWIHDFAPHFTTVDVITYSCSDWSSTMWTHWGRVTHICVSKLTIIASDNGLSPGRRQAIIWTSAGLLSIGPLGTKFSEIVIEIHTFSFKKMPLKMSSGKWRPFCLGLNVLMKGAHGGGSRAAGGDILSKKNSNLKHFMKIADYM